MTGLVGGHNRGEMRRRGGGVHNASFLTGFEIMKRELDTSEGWGMPISENAFPAKTVWSKIVDKIVDFTRHSSMHGLRYIGDRSLSSIERFFWIFAFIIAAMSSIYFITNLFAKYDQMPVIMSLSPRPSTIKELPFPAITVCNMNNMRKDEVDNVFEKFKNDPQNPVTQMDRKLVFDFCSRQLPPEDKPLETTMSNISSSNFQYIKDFLIKMTQPCQDLLVYCTWHGDKSGCNALFNPSLTDEGMCCLFNGLKRDHILKNPKNVSDLNVTFPDDSYDWTPERGFPKNVNPDSVPRRPRGSGTHLGLSIVINAELSRYYCSSENGEGFKVLLNNPLETPKVSSFALSVAPGRETKVVIVPKLMTAVPELRSIDISKRMCYFENEKSLYYYNNYNQKNCILECEANFTFALCQCVLYYMPKDKETRICGRVDNECAKMAQKQMEMSMDEAILNYSLGKQKLQLCNCKPGCHEVSYSFIVTQSPIASSLSINPDYTDGKNETYFKNNMAIIHFYYMDVEFTSTVRGVLFGFTELLSNTGGLLSLFLGFSFLSAVEVIYFAVVKVGFSLRKPRVQKDKSVTIKVKKKQLDDSDLIIKKNTFPFTQ